MAKKQELRQAELGLDMAEDFNLRFEDRDDGDRTRAAAFFLSWATLSPVTEDTFRRSTGMRWILNATGQKILTYDPPIDGVCKVTA